MNCSHYRVEPVWTQEVLDTPSELVAHICLDCDAALPADYTPPPPPLPSWNAVTGQHEGLSEEVKV